MMRIGLHAQPGFNQTVVITQRLRRDRLEIAAVFYKGDTVSDRQHRVHPLFHQEDADAAVARGRVRSAELSPMMIQLVASGRGVACLPNWALEEYLAKEYVAVRSLGEEGVWPTLYAAVRKDEADAAFIEGFVDVAKKTCFKNLIGIVTAEI